MVGENSAARTKQSVYSVSSRHLSSHSIRSLIEFLGVHSSVAKYLRNLSQFDLDAWSCAGGWSLGGSWLLMDGGGRAREKRKQERRTDQTPMSHQSRISTPIDYHVIHLVAPVIQSPPKPSFIKSQQKHPTHMPPKAIPIPRNPKHPPQTYTLPRQPPLTPPSAAAPHQPNSFPCSHAHTPPSAPSPPTPDSH